MSVLHLIALNASHRTCLSYISSHSIPCTYLVLTLECATLNRGCANSKGSGAMASASGASATGAEERMRALKRAPPEIIVFFVGGCVYLHPICRCVHLPPLSRASTPCLHIYHLACIYTLSLVCISTVSLACISTLSHYTSSLWRLSASATYLFVHRSIYMYVYKRRERAPRKRQRQRQRQRQGQRQKKRKRKRKRERHCCKLC